MEEESPSLPLRQRVPGAARAAPAAATARPALPESVLVRMQAAVDAARAEESRQDPEPTTEPLPRLAASGVVAAEGGSAAVNGTAVKHDHAAKRKRPAKKNRAASAKPAAQPQAAAQSQAPALSKRAAPSQSGQQDAPEPEISSSQLSAAQVDALKPPKRAGTAHSSPPKGPIVPKNAPWGPSAASAVAPAPPNRTVPTPSAQSVAPALPQRVAPPEPAARPEPAEESDTPWEKAEKPGAERRPSSTAPDSPAAKALAAPSGPPVTERAPAAPRTPPGPRGPAAGRIRPQQNRRPASRRRPFGPTRIVAAVVVIAAAAVGFMLSSAGAQGNKPESAFQRQEAANSKAAAAWVAKQVSPDALVSCDSQMCATLVNHRFPRNSVRILVPTSQIPLTSKLVIVTASVRGFFGSSVGAQWAPVVIATFGSGNARVTVNVIAPDGPAAYQRDLAKDAQTRKTIGGDFLHSIQINQSASAGKQMAAGQVDVRVLYAIAAVAPAHPVYIVDFGNIAPGNQSGIPLRYVDLNEDVPAAHLSSSAYLHAMLTLLAPLKGDYRPLRTVQMKLPGGVSALRIEFGAPTPLLLLEPQSTAP